ncbi:hypothetical protein PQJ75_27050 [Rhodoplanes sp. TEM]|uniref:Uncharacterized protein n=1 Tax=Rhodoplanes tepidamans TaxID=200616 RepID=A0ABT5JEU6_RHOTP|nr:MULTISPECIES: hypothetical protein [Rhodoplanes]MDC7788062.1 hypothetical protein [Rhodoplanes tepidamans]MDC7987408.1 hypothetical protein [Rhodoplanes sp. TEM]MDQ0353949.1 hypothetical protein [Rhodoplanes tepidamans]
MAGTILGIGAVVALLSFIAFAFRQGTKVEPDRDRRTEDWPRITLGGS